MDKSIAGKRKKNNKNKIKCEKVSVILSEKNFSLKRIVKTRSIQFTINNITIRLMENSVLNIFKTPTIFFFSSFFHQHKFSARYFYLLLYSTFYLDFIHFLYNSSSLWCSFLFFFVLSSIRTAFGQCFCYVPLFFILL